MRGAKALAIFGDSVTTDHISPAGGIKPAAPAGKVSSISPRPRIATGPSRRKSGQSDPSSAASSASSASVTAASPAASVRSARNAATASLLPPPSPAPIGTRFVREKRTPPRHPVRRRHAAAAFRMRFVPSTGTAGSSHASVVSAARSARNMSPNSSGATTDTRS